MSKPEKKITPLGDRVVLRLCNPPGKSPGGILIPDNAAKKPQKGEVLAVGPDCKTVGDASVGFKDEGEKGAGEKRIKKGQVVVFNQFAGTTAPDDDTLLLIREDELLGVVE